MSQRISQGILWVCLLTAAPAGLQADDPVRAVFPVSPFAADGVIRIDQSRAMAGSVTPGDTPGLPVTISEPGSYRLTRKLTIADLNTTAIQITADSVTLDLNGFSIIGPVVCTTEPTSCSGTGTGVGVQAGNGTLRSPRGVRVRNGTVRGMGRFGIWLSGNGSFVEKVTADSNADGGLNVAGTVIESAATQNGAFGIIALSVRDSTAFQNAGDGVILEANGGVATGNVSSQNVGSGIIVQGGTATGNTVFLNQGAGITALCPSSLVGNTIVVSGTATIETHGDGCALANNATRP